MKKILFLAMVIFPLFFVSCEEDTSVINPVNNQTTMDFLLLYGQSTDYIEHALKWFELDKDNTDSDGNTYWIVKYADDYPWVDGDQVFITLDIVGGKCVEVSLLFENDTYNQSAMDGIMAAYGEASKGTDTWCEWYLTDNSLISFYIGGKTLHIYRTANTSNNAPKAHQRIINLRSHR